MAMFPIGLSQDAVNRLYAYCTEQEKRIRELEIQIQERPYRDGATRIEQIEAERDNVIDETHRWKAALQKAEAESAQWQESSGQNYVRATEAEAREERLREALVLIRGWREIDRASPWEVLEEIERMVSKALGDTDGQ